MNFAAQFIKINGHQFNITVALYHQLLFFSIRFLYHGFSFLSSFKHSLNIYHDLLVLMNYISLSELKLFIQMSNIIKEAKSILYLILLLIEEKFVESMASFQCHHFMNRIFLMKVYIKGFNFLFLLVYQISFWNFRRFLK